jgi:hypothetical protein
VVSRIAQSVQCLVMGYTNRSSRIDPEQMGKDFSCSLCVQNGSGSYPASCTLGTKVPFHVAKARPGRGTDHSSPSIAEAENE